MDFPQAFGARWGFESGHAEKNVTEVSVFKSETAFFKVMVKTLLICIK